MFTIIKAQQRGQSRHDWLNSKHTFSFANYYNESANGFSDLLVINEDIVTPNHGFSTHPHSDMEIFTYVISGALTHQDSMGNSSIIQTGDIQLMSAGTGIKHSEFNASDEQNVHFLQIWIVPNQLRLQPSYQQKHIDAEQKRNQWCLLLSPSAEQQSLKIHQNVKIYSATLHDDNKLSFTANPNRYIYIHIVTGSLLLNGQPIQTGDGIKITQPQLLEFTQGNNAEILLFDLIAHDFNYR